MTTLESLERLQEALAETLRVAEQGLLLGVLDRWSVTRLQARLAGPFRPTVYAAGRFYSVGEVKQVLQMAAGGEAHVVRHPTLFPRGWPWQRANSPWGGFIATALRLLAMG